MKLEKYLHRIGHEYFKVRPTVDNLKLLQKKHLLNVAFENLDIHWDRPIILKTNKAYQKIVENNRGGFCYELNGLFFQLLNEIGFKSKIVSARVNSVNGEFGKEYDHLAILTEIEGDEYLVDVGFGDFIAEPLKFVLDIEQADLNGNYLIRKFDNEYFEVAKKIDDKWQSEYIFRDKSRDLIEFEGMCDFHQSLESHFSKGKVCSIMTNSGRKTLTDKRFIRKVNGGRTEVEVKSDIEFLTILEREFGIIK